MSRKHPMGNEHQTDNAELNELLKEARRLTPPEFAEAHRELFLLVQRSTLHNHAQFETDVPTGRGSVLPPALSSTEVSVVPIRKSLRSPYQDRISIGRARSCDVVIRDTSISKLQAYVFTGEDGSHAIVDVGSQNGTKIGSHRLVPQKPMPLKAGNILTLGAVVATTLDATSAQRALLRLHEGSFCR